MSKAKMCGQKLSFHTRGQAQRIADKFGQRVYECPICFCWHCTSKGKEHELVSRRYMEVRLVQQEAAIRHELSQKNRLLTKEIYRLQQELKLCKLLSK